MLGAVSSVTVTAADRDAVGGACAECGGPLPASGDCWDRVAELLEIETIVLDGGEASLRAHFYAIGAYQLQHPSRLTAEALFGLRDRVAQMVESPIPVAMLRREVRRRTRGTKVTSGTPGSRDHVPGAWPTRWSMTAADVVARPADAYVASVGEWAATTVTELAGIPAPRR